MISILIRRRRAGLRVLIMLHNFAVSGWAPHDPGPAVSYRCGQGDAEV